MAEETKPSKVTSQLCPDAKPFVYQQQRLNTGHQQQFMFSNHPEFTSQSEFVAAPQNQPPCNDWVIHGVPTYMTNYYPFVQNPFGSRYSSTSWPCTSETVIQPMFAAVQPFLNASNPQVYTQPQYYVPHSYNYSTLDDSAPSTTRSANTSKQGTTNRKEAYKYSQGQRPQRPPSAEPSKHSRLQQHTVSNENCPSNHVQTSTANSNYDVPVKINDVSSPEIPRDSRIAGNKLVASYTPHNMFKSSLGDGERTLSMDYLSRKFVTSTSINDRKNNIPAHQVEDCNGKSIVCPKVVESEDCFTKGNQPKTFASILKDGIGNKKGLTNKNQNQDTSSRQNNNRQFNKRVEEISNQQVTRPMDGNSTSVVNVVANNGSRAVQTMNDFYDKWPIDEDQNHKHDSSNISWNNKASGMAGRRHGNSSNKSNSVPLNDGRGEVRRRDNEIGKNASQNGLNNTQSRLIKNGKFHQMSSNSDNSNVYAFEQNNQTGKSLKNNNYSSNNFNRNRFGGNSEDKGEHQELLSSNSNQDRNLRVLPSEKHGQGSSLKSDNSGIRKAMGNVREENVKEVDVRNRMNTQGNFQKNRRKDNNGVKLGCEQKVYQSDENSRLQSYKGIVGELRPCVDNQINNGLRGNKNSTSPNKNSIPVDDSNAWNGKRFRPTTQNSENQPAVRELSACVGKLVLLTPETHSAILGGIKSSAKVGGHQELSTHDCNYPVLQSQFQTGKNIQSDRRDTVSSSSRLSYSVAVKKGAWNRQDSGGIASTSLVESDHDNNNLGSSAHSGGPVYSLEPPLAKECRENLRKGFPSIRQGCGSSDVEENSELGPMSNNRTIPHFPRKIDRTNRDVPGNHSSISHDLPPNSGSRSRKPKANAPIKFNIMDALIVKKKEKAPETAPVKKSGKRQQEVVNILDSSAPQRRRGKEREFQRKKKLSSTKKIILKEREHRHNLQAKTSHHSSSENVSTAGNTSDSDSYSDCASDTDDEKRWTEKDWAKTMVHSRAFREYCDHMLDKDIDEAVVKFLSDLIRFQDRQYARDPIRAKSKRRTVVGLREVTKHLKLKKLKCVIFAPNVEKIKASGGLDEIVSNIITLATEQQVPFIFALGRFKLGRVCLKKSPVSCVGIFNYQGSEEHFNQVMTLAGAAREKYDNMLAARENEVQQENQIIAQQNLRSVGLSSTSDGEQERCDMLHHLTSPVIEATREASVIAN